MGNLYMWQAFLAPYNICFSVAIAMLGLLLLIEILGFVFGGLSAFLDNLLPDQLFDTEFTIETDTNIGIRFLDWLYLGRIPTAILLILWLACFAITGFIIQILAIKFLGNPLSNWLASVDALAISLPLLRIIAKLIYPMIPKDETTAISDKDLIGLTAVIVLGEARMGKPAQAKVIDSFSQTHYIMVEPDTDIALIKDKPLHIIGQKGIVYLAVYQSPLQG